MKKLGLFLLYVMLFGIAYLVYLNMRSNSMYDDVIELHISPSNEECDDYNVLWEVNSVSDSSYSFIKNELVYLLNSQISYDDSLIEYENYLVEGILFKEKRKEHYLECGSPWIFSDSVVNNVTEDVE